MSYKYTYKTKQFFFALIKISIIAGAFYFIYQKLLNNKNLDSFVFYEFLMKNEFFLIKNILFLFFLSVINWFFEIRKWQLLVSEIRKINFTTALKQSLGAFTASLLTPNKIGEYGAKAIFYKKAFRKRILFINLMSNFMQMSITCLFGMVGFWYFSSKYVLQFDYYKLAIGFTIFAFVLLLGWYLMQKKMFNIKGFSLEKLKHFLKTFHKKKILLGFLLSLVRYVVFSFQFYFLLHIFKVDIGYFNAMMVISTMYFLSSMIPTLSLFDVLIKGSISLYLFSFVGVDALIILCTMTLMWLLNVVLPSFIGCYYVLSFKYPKETIQYDFS